MTHCEGGLQGDTVRGYRVTHSGGLRSEGDALGQMKARLTCMRLFSRADSSSSLAAVVSCWWVCLMCSTADAWMWFNSERKEADRS